MLPLLLFIPDERVNFLLRKDDRIGNRKATRKGFYLRHLLAYYAILGQFPKGRCTFILWGVEGCFERVMEYFFSPSKLEICWVKQVKQQANKYHKYLKGCVETEPFPITTQNTFITEYFIG